MQKPTLINRHIRVRTCPECGSYLKHISEIDRKPPGKDLPTEREKLGIRNSTPDNIALYSCTNTKCAIRLDPRW